MPPKHYCLHGQKFWRLTIQKKYFIYDSRVAIALKFLIREYDWFIPKRRNDVVGSYLRQVYKNALTESESYVKYSELLSNVEECKRGICCCR